MKPILTLTVFSVLVFSACESQKEKSVKAFEEGVTLHKDADAALEKGDEKTSADLHTKAIARFNETLQLDSTHKGARSAIASSYYHTNKYTEALDWYAKANQMDGEKAANYREMGLATIKMGDLNRGKELLEQSVALDPSEENRTAMINGLMAVGKNNFETAGKAKTKENAEEIKKQQNEAMSIMMLAYYYDNTRKDVAGTIAQYADEVGNNTVKVQYTKLSQQ